MVELDPRSREVWVAGQPLHLSPTEFALLHLLAAAPAQTFTRGELVDGLWTTYTPARGTRALDSHAHRLRARLRDAGAGEDLIQNVWGRRLPLPPIPRELTDCRYHQQGYAHHVRLRPRHGPRSSIPAVPPVAMLAASTAEWPEGAGWVLEPKFDGWRLFVETKPGGRVCAWSRHGTSMTAHLGELLAPIAALGAGWVFDGELIALSDWGGRPVQDFAAVSRAVFGGERDAIARLHYVAFDVLAAGDAGDIQARPLLERAAVLYRAGRYRSWRKLKAQRTIPATIQRLDRDGDGRLFARCVLADGRSCSAWVPAAGDPTCEQTTIVYSRVDANGSLREPRLAASPARTVAA